MSIAESACVHPTDSRSRQEESHMSIRTLIAIAGLSAVALTAQTVHATTIDFEDHAQASGNQTTLFAPLVSDGFLFTSSTDHGHLGNNALTFVDSTALVT